MSCERCGQEHKRCAAHRRDGNPCTMVALKDYHLCRMHGGRKSKAVTAEKKAERAVATYGLPVETDPHQALLDEVHRTAGHVRWLADTVAGLEDGNLVWGDTKRGRERGERTELAEAAPSIWLELYQRERAHLVKVSKAAIDAGIDERRVRLAEDQGQVIVQVLKATLQDLGVDVTEEVATTVGRHLRAVS